MSLKNLRSHAAIGVGLERAGFEQVSSSVAPSRVRGDERNLELDPSDGGLRDLERRETLRTGQATKGTRWMPRHQEAMKDVETCEKLRGVGLERRSVDIRMGKPGGRHGPSTCTEYIGVGGQRGELKHLSTPRKGNQ